MLEIIIFTAHCSLLTLTGRKFLANVRKKIQLNFQNMENVDQCWNGETKLSKMQHKFSLKLFAGKVKFKMLDKRKMVQKQIVLYNIVLTKKIKVQPKRK